MSSSITVVIIWSCSDSSEKKEHHKPPHNYMPHLGQMMLTNQVYHTKLYYAGTEQNWDLATLYTEELTENLEDITHIYPEYEGMKIKELATKTALRQLENLEKSVEKKSLIEFKEGYTQLTNSCNACHVATHHEFIKIKTPDRGNFANQIFTK